MKKIYKPPSYDAVIKTLNSFEKSWGEKYPYAIKSWKNNFDELVTFFDYPTVKKIAKQKMLLQTPNLYEK